MRKCLTSFDSYISTRTTKILNLLSFLPKSSLSSYTIVHTSHQNNIGILFQLVPKVQYYLDSKAEYNSIMSLDKYSKHIISPEELRFIDYSMDMKSKRHMGSVPQSAVTTPKASPFVFGVPSLTKSVPFTLPSMSNQSLHSLPIVYPYDESN